jgi:hypothetical protein
VQNLFHPNALLYTSTNTGASQMLTQVAADNPAAPVTSARLTAVLRCGVEKEET